VESWYLRPLRWYLRPMPAGRRAVEDAPVPFTLLHPAVVLPVARGPLVASALVAGAVAPDVPYYVPLQWLGGDYNLTLTHDATSLLWLDPALGLVLLAVFHALVKRPVVALLPDAVARRVAPALAGPTWRSPRVLAWVLVSVALGAASHVAWDALCDAFGYGWSQRLNLASDVLAAVVLTLWLVRWWRRTSDASGPGARLLSARARQAAWVAVVAPAVGWSVTRTVATTRRVSTDLRTYDEWSRSVVVDHAAREAVVQLAVGLGVSLLVLGAAVLVARLRSAGPAGV
jgi:hypothetical protein